MKIIGVMIIRRMENKNIERVFFDHCQKRFDEGAKEHGEFNPFKDKRNFLKMLIEELVDGYNYSQMFLMIMACQYDLKEKEEKYIKAEMGLLQALLKECYKIVYDLDKFVKYRIKRKERTAG